MALRSTRSGGWLKPGRARWLAEPRPSEATPAQSPEVGGLPGAGPGVAGASSPLVWLAPLLAVALVLPTELSLQAGPLRLSPYRLVLLLSFFPVTFRLFAGRAGGRRAGDFTFLLFALWAAAALGVNHGAATAIESGGILLVETFGAYALGRVAVRCADDFQRLAKWLVACAIGVLVVALPETLTGFRLVHEVFGAVLGGAPTIHVEPRFGLHRAFGPFDHPILNGVFGSTLVAMAWELTPKERTSQLVRIVRTALVAASGFTSLSSAAILSMVAQGGMLAWRKVTALVPGRWWLLLGLFLGFYATISVMSSRSGLRALMWYLTFDRHTASYRLLIWEHGSSNVEDNPWFGIGMNDWERPSWMSESVDSFWLLTTMMYGLPAIVLFAATVLAVVVPAAKRISNVAPWSRLGRAWAFALFALCFCGFTVHYWNNVFTMFGFLLGAGAWMGERVRRREEVGA